MKAFAIAAITLVVFALGLSMGWHKVMAQVPALTQTTNLSPALAATASEAKPTPKDAAPNPIHVSLLGSDRIVFYAQVPTNAVEQFW